MTPGRSAGPGSSRLAIVGMVALVAGGLIAGRVLTAFPVHAAGRVPTVEQDQIKDDSKSYKASVTSAHRLTVDAEADKTNLGTDYLNTYGYQFVQPNGEAVIAQPSGCSGSLSQAVVLSAIQANLSTANPAINVTILVNNSAGGSVWSTTWPENTVGSREISFDGGIYLPAGFSVTSSPTAGLECQFLGQDLTTRGAPAPRG